MTYLMITSIFFAIGLYGVMVNRNLVRLFISLSIMLAAVALTLASSAHGGSIVLFIWVVEVLEIIMALSLFIYLKKNGITNLDELEEFRG